MNDAKSGDYPEWNEIFLYEDDVHVGHRMTYFSFRNFELSNYLWKRKSMLNNEKLIINYSSIKPISFVTNKNYHLS